MQQFFLFGNIGTQGFRQELVEYISARLLGKASPKEPETDEESLPFLLAVKQILTNIYIPNNQALLDALLHEIIERLQDIQRIIKKENTALNPEIQAFHQFKNTGREQFRLHGIAILKQIASFIDTNVYQKTFLEIQFKINENKSSENIFLYEELDALKSHLQRLWAQKIREKEQAKTNEILQNESPKLQAELTEKIINFQSLQKILNPFISQLGWNYNAGFWQESNFEILQKYAEMLEKNPQVQALAQALGRWKRAELANQSIDNKLITNNFNYYSAQKSELVGIQESGEWNHALPNEMALLAENDTENLFYKKLTEKKLQTWQYQTALHQKQNNKEEKTVEKGAFIICVDTSSSMRGEAETIAKTLAFAILKIALQERRKAYLIAFSTQIACIDLSDLSSSLPQLVQFLSMSFHGGTDAQPALLHALQLLSRKNYEKADVLFVSDFVMPNFNTQTRQLLQRAKANKTRFFSLFIGKTSGKLEMENEFDFNWRYNAQQPEKLLELLKGL